MMLRLEEVKKIARLARIDLSSPEAVKFRTELSEIIDYNARKLSKVKKISDHRRTVSKELGQDDRPRPSLPSEDALANAPSQKENLFSVPRVLE